MTKIPNLLSIIITAFPSEPPNPEHLGGIEYMTWSIVLMCSGKEHKGFLSYSSSYSSFFPFLFSLNEI